MLSTATRLEWDRQRWLAFADTLLETGRAHLSPNGAQILYPGDEGGYGRAVDGLEGFARTLLIAGFRIVGERGQGVDALIEFCRRGITAGVDPGLPDRWVRLDEHAQAKVEAASIALILDMTRPWVWDQLDDTTQRRVIDYLSPVVGDETYPKTNWLWFRVVVETFLRSVGGPWSQADIDADLALHDDLQRADGWISDGRERSYDHYAGWALHLYPVLWSRMRGADQMAGSRRERDILRLDRYLQDAVALVGADGSPLLQGRSLIYRFAAAAPFWAGVLANVPSVSPGLLRRAAERVVSHFADHGVPDDAGVLTIGWHREWRALAQSYSGPGSPYWAAKGLIGIALPADHPVWAAEEELLSVETADEVRAVAAPGWIVSSTRADGIVRVTNHGTDHAMEGDSVGDSPLYARLGYSTATAPLLDDASWRDPLDQAVVLLDPAGRATHRSGMVLGETHVHEGVGVAGSCWEARWLDPQPTAQRHGSGLQGVLSPAGRLDVRSLVRGPWEVRLIRVVSVEPGVEITGIRVGGWPVSGDDPSVTVEDSTATATAGGVTSVVQSLSGAASAAVETRSDASPLGAKSAVPVLHLPVVVGTWTAALVALTCAAHASGAVTVGIATGTDADTDADTDSELTVDVVWPDGHATTTRLKDPRFAAAAADRPLRSSPMMGSNNTKEHYE